MTKSKTNNLFNVTFIVTLVCLVISLYSISYIEQYGNTGCMLCTIQRYIYIAVSVIGVISIIFKSIRGKLCLPLGLMLLLLFANSMVALYQTGVEYEWWPASFCPATEEQINELIVSDGKEAIGVVEEEMVSPCASFTDVFGLSMAAWSFIISGIMTIYGVINLRCAKTRRS